MTQVVSKIQNLQELSSPQSQSWAYVLDSGVGKRGITVYKPIHRCAKKESSHNMQQSCYSGKLAAFLKRIKYWNVVCLYDRRESHKKNVNQMLTDVTKIMI